MCKNMAQKDSKKIAETQPEREAENLQPRYKDSVIKAMKEAERIASDPTVKGYDSIDELMEALEL